MDVFKIVLAVFGIVHLTGGQYSEDTIFLGCVQPSCPDGWVVFDNSCYLFADYMKVNWENATANCSAMNAHVVDIENTYENQFVREFAQRLSKGNVRQKSFYWLGANDMNTEGRWEWNGVNNTVTFSDWDTRHGQPQGGTTENCVLIHGPTGFHWHDADCTHSSHFVCEKSALPCNHDVPIGILG